MSSTNDSKVGNSTSLTAIFLMVFSGALLLFLIGIYLILGMHSDNIVTYLKEHTAIVFELESNLDSANALVAQLKLDERLRSPSVEFISAEEGLKFMRKEMGGQVLPEGMENPFSDLITSYVKVLHTDKASLDQLRTDWLDEKGVADVYFQNDYLKFWDEWKGRILKFTLFATLILLLITVLLIHNTVKLTVFMKRKNIEILELVGASWDFIRTPFLRVALKMGLVSALLASVFLAFILSILVWQQPFLADYFNWYYMVLTILSLILVGVLLQYVSTRVVLNGLLKNTVEHLKS